MTREDQTIAHLKKLKSFHNGSYGADIDRAIRVMKQDHCEDCVSRQAVTDAVENIIAKYIPSLLGRQEKLPLELAMAINSVPPVILKQRGLVRISDIYRLIVGHSDYHGDNILSALTCLAEGKEVKNPIAVLKQNSETMNNKQWIDFLAKTWNISRTSAKDMLHVMMVVKREDNFKKQFSGAKMESEQE